MSRHHGLLDPWTVEMRRGIRRDVIRIHGLVCWLCKLPIASDAEATMDHVKKASKGGEYTVENLRPAHAKCNNERHRKPAPTPKRSTGR